MDPTRQRAETEREALARIVAACERHDYPCIAQRSAIIAELREARAEGRREGLREAADAMDQSESPRWTCGEVRDWLMSRASESAPTPEDAVFECRPKASEEDR